VSEANYLRFASKRVADRFDFTVQMGNWQMHFDASYFRISTNHDA